MSPWRGPSARRLLPALLLSGSTLLAAACTSSGPPTPGQPLGARDASDRFAVFWDSYERDLVEGDPARLASWFTSDAELMEPGTETLRGRNEIHGHLERILETFRVTQVEITPREVRVYGDWAYDIGTAVETVEERTAGAEASRWRSRYAAVWTQSSDGRWRIHRLLLSPMEGPTP